MIYFFKELLLYSTFFVSFFSFISLWIGGFKENKSKLALSLYMLAASLFYAFSILKYLNYYEVYNYLESFYIGILPLAFPLLYIYIRSLVVNKWFHKKLLLHFTPFFVISILTTFLYFNLNYSERIYYLNNSQNENFAISTTMQNLYYVFQLTTYIYFAQGIIYFWGILQFYRKYRVKITMLYSDHRIKELKRLELIIYLISIMIITHIISANIIGLNKIWDSDLSVILAGIFITFTVGLLGILGAKQKNIYAAESYITNNEHSLNSPVDELKISLLHQFNEKKIFLKKDLNIWDVCVETHSNRTYISQLINTEFGLNFNCFVNKYRIEEAKEILRKREYSHLSLLKIAKKAGFNSLSSFNRSFLKFEEKSPGKYRSTF